MSASRRPPIPVLRAVRLNRSFGDGAARRFALRDVSLTLYSGQLALLMGPSGSGKSTLLAVLSGLLRPDSGSVFVDDDGVQTDLWHLSDGEMEKFRLRHTGFIFQGYNLFPALSAMQQLEIVLKWGSGLGDSAARTRAGDMLNRLGMDQQKYKKPAQLSGGEKQRVAIGRALVKEPTFIFADEPTSALDWENGQRVIELLRAAAHARGASIFVVSHDERMRPFADVIYHLDDGHLAVEQNPVPLTAAGPYSPEVAR
jgi:putative ABC transport system ATP-binding protein